MPGFSGQPQDGDRQVAQAGHDAGIAGSDLGAILASEDFADPL
jgi:hypothetical protein